MKTDVSSKDRDPEAKAPPVGTATRDGRQPTGRSTLALFVLAELLCTAVFLALIFL